MDDRSRRALTALAGVSGAITTILAAVEDTQKAIGVKPLTAASLVLVTVAVALGGRTLRTWIRHSPVTTLMSVATTGASLIVVNARLIHGLSWEMTMLMVVIGLIVVVMIFLGESVRTIHRASTEYVGKFPADLPYLAEYAAAAKKSIIVVTDVIAYGAFSAPDLHSLLVAELGKAARRGVRVVWYSYNDTATSRAVLAQLDLAGATDEDPRAQSFLKGPQVRQFVNYFQGFQEPATVNQFMTEMLLRKNDEAAASLRDAGVRVHRTIESGIPMYVWLFDETAAMISVRVAGVHGTREDCFRSIDPGVIAFARDIMSGYDKTKEAL
ncbi:MAG TPA: hypothetical protein VFZ65_14815 [Planctomycetota bacterium]|nr:hypothetical protein [Planctomycetota bacterium]